MPRIASEGADSFCLEYTLFGKGLLLYCSEWETYLKSEKLSGFETVTKEHGSIHTF